MDDFNELIKTEKVQRLLEDAERAMRLAADVGPEAAPDVQRALDSLFRDIGRTVYNLYWSEDLEEGEAGAELAQITSEEPTESVKRDNSEPRSEEVPGFSVKDLPDIADTPEDDTGWYTAEVEIPDRPLFTESDGLEEDIPESDPIPGGSTSEDE